MKNSTQKKDIYQEITDRIIKCLEEGATPWLKPRIALIITLRCLRMQYPVAYTPASIYYFFGWQVLKKVINRVKWLTAQVKNKLGGHVRKGENYYYCKLSPG